MFQPNDRPVYMKVDRSSIGSALYMKKIQRVVRGKMKCKLELKRCRRLW